MDNSVKVANEQGLEMQPYTSFRIVRTFVDCADCTNITWRRTHLSLKISYKK